MDERAQQKYHFREFNAFSRRWCIDRTKKLNGCSYSFFFREHPSLSVPNYEEYSSVVKNPMWFKEVLDRLYGNAYVYVHEWVVDMESIWCNAMAYNSPNTPGYDCALILQHKFRKKCIPVPYSQKSLVAIRRYKVLKKLAKHLLSPPEMIRNLQWEIPKIEGQTRVDGEEIVFQIRDALFHLDPDVKEKLFEQVVIQKIETRPQEVIDEIKNDDNDDQQCATIKDNEEQQQ